MDKNLLYSLPKDILIELVCKQFNGLSLEQLGDIYTDKCLAEMNKYRDILNQIYIVGTCTLQYNSSNVFLKCENNFYLDIDIYDNIITYNEIEMRYTNSEIMLNEINGLLLFNISSAEEISKIMDIIKILIKARAKKKETKKIIRSNNLYI